MSALLACMEMVRNGTTTFCDSGARFSARLNASAANKVGMRGTVSEVCWDNPPHPDVGVGNTDQCVARLETMISELPSSPDSLTCANVGISGMGRCSDELVVRAKDIADAHGLTMSMHLSFSPAEKADDAHRETTPVAHLAELGVLDTNLALVHMIFTEEPEIPFLVSSGTNVVHCPAASARVGVGVSRIGMFPEMVAQGVNVSLGSDSGNYSDSFDVGRQAYLTSMMHRDTRRDVSALSAEQVLEMATVNGARTMGMTEQIGSLEVGKRADIVMHTRKRPEWHPGLDVVTSFVYSAQCTGVDTVLVDGDVVLERGVFTGVDEDAEYTRIDRAARELYQRMGYRLQDRWPVT